MSLQSKEFDLKDAAEMLRKADNIYILSHQYPDGDTLGSAAALCFALRRLGKRAQIYCNDSIPQKYDYIFEDLEKQDFKPEFIVAVDVADVQLLGKNMMRYADLIDLCIDHHGSNTHYTQNCVIRPSAAATTEIIYDLIQELQVEVDKRIANCIYTGISTDTGCFRYTNATPHTYRVAAEVMEKGADAAFINRVMFDTKSRARLEIERRVLDTMEFFYGGRCAIVYVTKEMVAQSGAGDDDMDGLAAIPRQIEGVKIGVTMREKDDGCFKVSMRSGTDINVSELCAKFGGGGHPAAAGCVLSGTVAASKKEIIEAMANVFGAAE